MPYLLELVCQITYFAHRFRLPQCCRPTLVECKSRRFFLNSAVNHWPHSLMLDFIGMQGCHLTSSKMWLRVWEDFPPFFLRFIALREGRGGVVWIGWNAVHLFVSSSKELDQGDRCFVSHYMLLLCRHNSSHLSRGYPPSNVGLRSNTSRNYDWIIPPPLTP